jgi:hypothetical protein
MCLTSPHVARLVCHTLIMSIIQQVLALDNVTDEIVLKYVGFNFPAFLFDVNIDNFSVAPYQDET